MIIRFLNHVFNNADYVPLEFFGIWGQMNWWVFGGDWIWT